MRKHGALIVLFMSVMINGLLLSACGSSRDGEVEILSEESSLPEATRSEGSDDIAIRNGSEANNEEKDYKDVLANSKTISIYCINDDGTDIESVVTYIDELADIDAEFVVEQVVNEFSNHNLSIKVEHVMQEEEGTVLVDFSKDTVPVCNVEAETETLILDCLSQSILDNVKESQSVVFQVEGDAYKSKNLAFKANEAYDWK